MHPYFEPGSVRPTVKNYVLSQLNFFDLHNIPADDKVALLILSNT